jgi:hypothetical protein
MAYGLAFVFIQMHAALIYELRSHKLRKMGTNLSRRDASVTGKSA